MNLKNLIFNIVQKRKQLFLLYSLIFLTGILWISIRKYLHIYTGFSFLFKNYILAILPLVMSSFLVEMNRMKFKSYQMKLLGFLWLLFLPNAPYILTDYKYLWLDMYTYSFLAYLSWFILPSFLAGFISLNDVEGLLKAKYSLKKVNGIMALICLITGFGVALGSVLRFNSWDILHRPLAFFRTVIDLFLHPFAYNYFWQVTVSYSLLLFMLLKALAIISKALSSQEN